jgi:hypothetical protein
MANLVVEIDPTLLAGDTVLIAPVSGGNSLQTGIFAGNFAKRTALKPAPGAYCMRIIGIFGRIP